MQLEWMTGDMPLPPPTAPLQTLPHGVVSTAAGAAAQVAEPQVDV